MLFLCRVTEVVEREVVVEAPGPHMARMKAAHRAEWIDTGAATTVAVEVEHVQPHESEGDPLQAWVDRQEQE
jgi:hypothetical protein